MQTTTILFRQLLEQVEQLDSLIQITQRMLAVYESPYELTSTLWQDAQQQWQLLQQQISNRQQNLSTGLQRLQYRIEQIQLLQNISEHFDAQVNISAVLESGLDAVWQKAPLRFAVVVLGDAELGPYTYQSMRGVSDAWRFVGKSCPFPLWGVLARALLPRLDPDEPDYLVIQDIDTAKRPQMEEFPWMPLNGSLMILPLRTQARVIGAFLLGCEVINGFADQILCNDYYAIAYMTARILQVAKIRQELNDRSNQLLSLQLFTKSIATAPDFDKLSDVLGEGIRDTFGLVDVLVYMNGHIWSKEITAYGDLEPYVRSIIDWAMQAGQPIFYDPDDHTESLERFYYNESGRALVTPVTRGERTLGVIQIIAKEPARYFEESDLIVLRTIANSVAIAFESVTLRLFAPSGDS